MNALDEEGKILLGLFPPDWELQARRHGAVARLRGFDSVNEVLRALLLHVGCGYSLRETAVRAKAAGIAEVSDVTLLNRLRQAEGWLHHLCQSLWCLSGSSPSSPWAICSSPTTRVPVPGFTENSSWHC